jgi:signal transduction histidine kinase
MVALESAELFRGLKPEELAALRLVAAERQVAAGKEIFREGDPGDGVYVVKDGLVEISGLLNAETRRVYSQIAPGGLFGEMAVIEHRPRSATATATKPSVVYFIPRGEMLSLIERSPGLSLSLLQLISHRLRDFNQHYLRETLQAERLAVLGRFARAIVHDLKNPLNIIGLTTETVCLPTANPEIRLQARDRIRKQIERINDLVGEILLFTQGPRAGLVVARLDFRAVIIRITEELKADLAARGCVLAFENEPPSVRLLMDPNRLRRVFINLASNAADVMPRGGKIRLHFQLNAREVTTEVADDGPGIAPEVADKLFEAFATHGKAHGTGLGLSICKKIIEDHGGRIWATNNPRGGAVFSFAIPLPA